MHICKFCGKKFEKGNQLGGHIVRCSSNPNFKKIIRKNKVQDYVINKYGKNFIELYNK